MNNTDKEYLNLLKKIISEGTVKGNRTGTPAISIPFASIEFDMSEGFPLLTTKKMFTKGIIHELIWFLQGDTNIKYLVENGVNIWTPDAYREYINLYNRKPYKESYNNDNNGSPWDMDDFKRLIQEDNWFSLAYGALGPVYGHQWVNWGGNNYENGINQIQNSIDKLINKPDDRRNMVSAWNVSEIDDMTLPPCHYGFQLYTEELDSIERTNIGIDDYGIVWNKLVVVPDKILNDYDVPKRKVSLIWDQRSVDTFLGLPFNIASYGILLHIFAQQANMVPHKLIGSLKNVHIYENHINQCGIQMLRDPRPLPKLKLNKADDIFSYKFDDIEFEHYNPHPTIRGEISV